MTVNKKDNLDSSKNSKSYFLLQDLLQFDKNVFIGLSLLASAIYLINILIRPNISPNIQGFLVVIIGLLLIVAIDFFKKDSNSTISNVRENYPRIENNYYSTYNGDYIYNNTGNTNYSSEKNIEQVAEEIKQIIEKVSQNITDSNIEDMQIIEAELIEKTKHDEPEITKELTNKDLSIVAKTIETIEQNQPLKKRIINILKMGKNEVETLKQFLDAPSLTVASSSFIITCLQNWDKNHIDINNLDIKHKNENYE